MGTAPYGDHSTLEVVVHGADYDKEVVSRPIDPTLPEVFDRSRYHEHGYPPHDGQSGHALPVYPGGNTVQGKRETICGLKRRTFIIVACVAALLIALAIGVGAGVGATMRSRDSGGSAGAATNSTGDAIGVVNTSSVRAATTTSTTSTSSVPPQETPPSATTSVTKTTSTSASSTTTSSVVKIGGIGGRCSNQWGGDCICLEEGVCRNKWKGTPYTGTDGNRPCPNDPSTIMACVVKPCLGKVAPSQCLWKETCRQLNPGMIAVES